MPPLPVPSPAPHHEWRQDIGRCRESRGPAGTPSPRSFSRLRPGCRGLGCLGSGSHRASGPDPWGAGVADRSAWGAARLPRSDRGPADRTEAGLPQGSARGSEDGAADELSSAGTGLPAPASRLTLGRTTPSPESPIRSWARSPFSPGAKVFASCLSKTVRRFRGSCTRSTYGIRRTCTTRGHKLTNFMQRHLHTAHCTYS